MKRSAMAWAAALVALALPGAAFAQKAPPAKAAAPAITQKEMDRGMKEAPPLVQAAGVPCQVSGAAFRGTGSVKGADGKPSKVNIYEVACTGSLGYLIQAPEGGAKPQAFDCLAAQGSSTQCALPANADPKQGLAGIVTAAGKTCAVSDGRYAGTSTSSGATYYEVACGEQPGYLISVPQGGGKPEATDCAALLGNGMACKLTTKDQVIASLKTLVQQSGKTCQVSDARWVGESTTSGDKFYEIACGSQPGFMLQLASNGQVKQAIDCGRAQNLAGGCKMTDTTVAESAESATYTDLARKAGFPCQVSKYRFIGTDKDNREVVELACSNRPDGALAFFSDKGPSQVVDCVKAEAYGQACKLTSLQPIYAKYTEALAAKGKGSCKVSGAAFVGSTPQGEQFIETACADGQPGWVIGFSSPATDSVKELLNCRQAAASGSACKLPTNVAGNKGG